MYAYLKSKISNSWGWGWIGDCDNKEMAGILDVQYTAVFTMDDTGDLPEAEFLYTGDENKLKNIKQSGALGPDIVWSRVLHAMADIMAGSLAVIYNKLMEEWGGCPSSGRWSMCAPSSREPMMPLPSSAWRW